jgi:subtilisin family serine protease
MIKYSTFPSRYLYVFAVLLSGLLVLPAIAQTPPDLIAPPDLKDRYIVSFLPGTTGADRLEAARRAGAMPLVDLGLINALSVRIPGLDILAALQGNSAVVKVVQDRRVFALQAGLGGSQRNARLPAGSATGSQSHRRSALVVVASSETVPAGVARVGEPTSGAEGSGVGIMIGDTGIDWTHPDLNVASDRFDAFGGDCMDGNGHGTHVAGTAAAMKNGMGVVGVAPGATLYCGKVLSDSGSGSDSNIIELLQWVVNKNAAGASPPILVVNLSLGREKRDGDTDGPLHEAIKALYNSGVTVIVAAGNDASVEVKDQAPSGFPEVIAVASTTAEEGNSSRCPFHSGTISADTASYFTTDGAFDTATRIGVTISAPGGTRESVNSFCRIYCEGIQSTAIGGGTTNTLSGSPACGTSMAAPHVSGLVARLIEAGVSGPENVRARLRLDAQSAGTDPLDSSSAAYTYDGEREGVAVWRY